ncbi:hypothetical protein NliqN6_2919 [Naganishia liquefaciens]|uniref:Protein arginine methyltransferase NDUFAF7 n=1 Tax=Naganishia liquefaciens TaxID=104408 RepID=A0A8H3YFS9_9TREE|nr:hypothetical protein NliqN6_2919 [Naganishia liquefaciens]
MLPRIETNCRILSRRLSYPRVSRGATASRPRESILRWNSSHAAPSTPQFEISSKPSATSPDPSHSGQLLKLIKDSIKITGPLPVARYMQFCLGHPTQGYYTRKRTQAPGNEGESKVLEQVETDVFGRKGDFITSPEISQMFGELVGVWFLTQWVAQGRPDNVRIVELGPGRGTLLDDILRTFQSVPSFPSTALRSVNLVETSEPLRAQQRAKIQSRLETFGEHGKNVNVEFWNWVGEIPVEKDTFTIVLAHEFFDALPIHVFQKTEEGWREIFVNVDSEWVPPATTESRPAIPAEQAHSTPSTDPTSGLTLALSRESSTLSDILPTTSSRFEDVPVGGRVEISKDSYEMMRMVGKLVSGLEGEESEAQGGIGGVGLIVDYGMDGFSTNSFRAFRRHEIVHVFDDPGSADLTANVDFAYMKEALAGVATPHGPINQRSFLTSLGLAPRLDRLLQSAKTKEQKIQIANAARRLVQEDGMGGEYQFLGITPRPAGSQAVEEEVYPFEV